MSHTGHVKWFDRKKGIGFVTPVEGGEDVFIHRRNFAKDAATGKQFVVDEGDEIYFNLGSHEDRVTAIEISLPIGTEKKPVRRNRGRNAKKDLDSEAEAVSEAREEAYVETGSAPAPAAAEATGTGGRDSKTHRRGVMLSHLAARLALPRLLRTHTPCAAHGRAIARRGTTRASVRRVTSTRARPRHAGTTTATRLHAPPKTSAKAAILSDTRA